MRIIPKARPGRFLRTFPDPQSLAAGAVALFLEAVGHAVSQRGRFAVALAGGRTPRQFYEALAGAASGRVPWGAVEIFFGDERPVPPEHPDSNYAMAQASLLGRVPLPPGQVHRIRAELAPASAADEYERTLRARFRLSTGEVPRFDLVLLGLGADGHTASLFPGTNALSETQRLVCANWVPKFGHHRVTLTLPVLNAARQVVFLVAGADKAEVVKEVLAGPDREPPHPATLVQPAAGELHWLLDAAAASALPHGPTLAADSAG
ncbi:MAG: 6-phosphogluconolactonase [Verrucomicrobia bacterium]|jgi:6-phosphogluconolactonase|nr:6-phosphogluconolactonase [Verrucomicrobiota bacterium]